jgi:Meiotically up-regulated gene 113
MVNPAHQDLYVMQNEFGLIKIGRSLDVFQRREALQISDRCQIEIVGVYAKCGDLEESIHIKLRTFRLAGEWFRGTKVARQAVRNILQDGSVDWPYSYNAKGAQDWLNHIGLVRRADYIRRELYRHEKILMAANGPLPMHDYSVLRLIHLASHGTEPKTKYAKLDGELIRVWVNPVSSKLEPLPSYSSDKELALQLWPLDVRPRTWNGTALACCIEALRAIRLRLPKVARR